MIDRYTIYCAYTNQNPQPELVQESVGMWVRWSDHADVVNKLKNCGNCDSSIFGNSTKCNCAGCDIKFSNWEMAE